MNILAMTLRQKKRSGDLYRIAKEALEALASERLNLDLPTRDRLDEARQSLEAFDYERVQQPLKGVDV